MLICRLCLLTLRDELNERAKLWVEGACSGTAEPTDSHELQQLRKLLQEVLLPRLLDCERETEQLLRGLSGKFIQPGPSGAPTRGRYDVLPTGRNFYAVDPRTIPTQTAWKCGQGLADRLLDRYREEHGTDLRHLALVIWGTSNMRTGGTTSPRRFGSGVVVLSGSRPQDVCWISRSCR